MATATLLNPVSEEAENRKKEAKKHWEVIKKNGGLVSVSSLRIGYHVAILERDNLWGILGYSDKKEAQKESGVKDSTWFNVLRIASAFPGVSEELFVGMKLSNAEALMDLPESKRLTEYWLRKAATEPIELFALQIDEELNGKAKASDGREKSVALKIDMPKSAKKAVEEGILEFAESVGHKGDISKGLELLVAEHRDGVSLIESIHKAIDRIAEIKKLSSSGLSAEEVLEKTDKELDEMLSLFTQALQGVQNLESE